MLSSEERGLFRERIRSLDKKIHPGLTKLTWASKGISDYFIGECRNNCSKVVRAAVTVVDNSGIGNDNNKDSDNNNSNNDSDIDNDNNNGNGNDNNKDSDNNNSNNDSDIDNDNNNGNDNDNNKDSNNNNSNNDSDIDNDNNNGNDSGNGIGISISKGNMWQPRGVLHHPVLVAVSRGL